MDYEQDTRVGDYERRVIQKIFVYLAVPGILFILPFPVGWYIQRADVWPVRFWMSSLTGILLVASYVFGIYMLGLFNKVDWT
jgi:hypothetical protein